MKGDGDSGDGAAGGESRRAASDGAPFGYCCGCC